MKTTQMINEKLSLYGFDETVNMLQEIALKMEWGNPATHDLQQNLAKSGKIVRPVKVIEVCKPAYSGAMLDKSDERIVSVMMPCRISVYEKEDGKIYVSTISGAALAGGMPENIRGVMIAAADEVEVMVNNVTSK